MARPGDREHVGTAMRRVWGVECDTSRVMLVFRARETRVITSRMSRPGQWRSTLLVVCFKAPKEGPALTPLIALHNVVMCFL
jgi:hypothetical protein